MASLNALSIAHDARFAADQLFRYHGREYEHKE
jgi:hypothetical protein